MEVGNAGRFDIRGPGRPEREGQDKNGKASLPHSFHFRTTRTPTQAPPLIMPEVEIE